MMILGGVPIMVIMPPSIDAKDKGIKVSEGLRLAFAAACRSTGINIASAATLFMTADRIAAIPAIAAMWVLQGYRETAYLLGDQFDGTGIRQALADNQHQRNNDRGGMTKTGKGSFLGHHTDQQRHDQGDEGHQVIAPTAPYQENEYEKQQSEQQYLVCSHNTSNIFENPQSTSLRIDPETP